MLFGNKTSGSLLNHIAIIIIGIKYQNKIFTNWKKCVMLSMKTVTSSEAILCS